MRRSPGERKLNSELSQQGLLRIVKGAPDASAVAHAVRLVIETLAHAGILPVVSTIESKTLMEFSTPTPAV